MDPELLAAEVDSSIRRGKRPKAVLVVDVFGQCAHYEPILRTRALHDIPVIEDAAEALGASYAGRPAGVLGDIGCFSFNGNKIITTSGGGMLIGRKTEWVERARFLATQARDPAPHYEHSCIGYNYRLSNLLAGIGIGQLRVLGQRVEQRRALFERYRRALDDLPGIAFMPELPQGRCSRWLTCITVDPEAFGADREAIRLELDRRNIESRPLWKPMHLQPVFSQCRVRGGEVAEDLFQRGLCLPSGSSLTEPEHDRILDTIRRMACGRS